MTGNLTQLVLDLVELLRSGATDAGPRQRIAPGRYLPGHAMRGSTGAGSTYHISILS